jgi:hypothetical protein
MSRTHDVMISAFDLDRLESELTAVTEQRDRLAEACKLLMRVIGDPAENWWPTEDEVNAAWNSGSEALAAVKSQPTKS